MRPLNLADEKTQLFIDARRSLTHTGPIKMNPYDRDPQFAIDASGLLCQSRDEHHWQGARATLGALKGELHPIYQQPPAISLLSDVAHPVENPPLLEYSTTTPSFLSLASGKHYYEVTVTDEGLCRVGWSTLAATLELGW